MRSRVTFHVLALGVVVAFAFGAGCGGNDNNDNGGGPVATRTATPVRTATPAAPAPTATPGPGATRTVAFAVTATAALDGFQFTATYPTAKGSFTGSADSVSCTTTAGGIFTKNDQDNGNLILSVANTSDLTFPITITCTFDQVAGQTLAVGDLGSTSKAATASGGGTGDPNSFTVTASVS
ncbi:MAG: hypothetical protein HY271_02150 [Deltaproteobacteria bacterium]|nr:hypothetical protein [Deltaproteobacteria bacterium]